MPWWLALMAVVLSAYATVRSYAANERAKATGRLWLLFWPLPRNWGIVNRDDNPHFFKFASAFDIWRTTFLAVLTLLLGAYFFEATGLLS